jgi:hypothetical protein
MFKILILFSLFSCSTTDWDEQSLAYNKCATTCRQQGFTVEQSSLNNCRCGFKTNFESLQAIP